MGNSMGGKKGVKVMKINGETMKFKAPIYAGEVVKGYPGHVLLESEAVKHFGIRAKPLELQEELRPRRLYFLVELPTLPEEKIPRKVRSGIQMSAKDRLETLKLARRSISDLSIMKPAASSVVRDEMRVTKESSTMPGGDGGGRHVRMIKMRVPKAQVEKLMMESRDEAEAASKIVDFCMASNKDIGAGDLVKRGLKSREKRVGFLPEEEIQLAVA